MLKVLLVPLLLLSGCGSDNASIPSPDGSGKSGSLARFTISGDHLFIVDHKNLHQYDIQDASNPIAGNTIPIGVGIETIFPYGQNLFIGAQDGMHIFDISNPGTPKKLSEYQHITSCDPVVVQGNYAYVTLRSGTDCRFGENLLDVVDISNLKNPVNKATYGMLNPHGLGIDGTKLFVCEGAYGLKAFDSSDPSNLIEKTHITDIHATDLIPLNGLLLVIGKDGLYQYDYSDIASLSLLSKIPIN
ncbi:hypothetical protein QQ008_05190 [Fulvivirgaceae bacterium BMA10]|uniref:LVIVD repeat-containing protein n=1 Tax=Splendidivirga corallicola TaxID=3051826 RepID=A0ABT8KJ38_9BACT|nr:hypothetical protein [Fulvivirgaceae bacterium BMA10]